MELKIPGITNSTLTSFLGDLRSIIINIIGSFLILSMIWWFTSYLFVGRKYLYGDQVGYQYNTTCMVKYIFYGYQQFYNKTLEVR